MEPEICILVVDDEPQIGKIFGLKLKLAGFKVETTTSGAEAIERVRNKKFDVMLLDVLMPEVTGMDVLYAVRSFSKIPIILFTARADIFDFAKRIGANDFVSKPLDPELVVAKIKNVLNSQQSTSQ